MFTLSTLEENPVFQAIRKQRPEDPPKWNFFKYLIDGNGQVVKVFNQQSNPLSLVDDIEELLAKTGGGGRLVIE
jgi:glutathione peroxidase